ncbi:MAG: DUF1653 domain-containing protein [Anaerorhabdus sp.]
MSKFKQRLFEIYEAAKPKDKASKIMDITIFSLIILNVIVVSLSTFNLGSSTIKLFKYIEIISIIIFTIEYISRVYTSDLLRPKMNPFKARIRYIFSFMALVDLFAILPFYFPKVIPLDLRIIRSARILKLLRAFKKERYYQAIEAIHCVFIRKKNQLISSLIVISTLIIISAVIMFNLEASSQPEKFKSIFDALWLVIATITTVGYGDIYPITFFGKILGIIIAILGIAIIAIPTGIISSGFIELQNNRNKSINNNLNISNDIKIKGIYRHFKGNFYLVEDIAIDSETLQEMVVYRPLYGDRALFVRPLDMFKEKLDDEKYPNANQKHRFEECEIN